MTLLAKGPELLQAHREETFPFRAVATRAGSALGKVGMRVRARAGHEVRVRAKVRARVRERVKVGARARVKARARAKAEA